MARLGPEERPVFDALRRDTRAGLGSVALRERVAARLAVYLRADAYCAMELDPTTALPVHDVNHGWPAGYEIPLIEEGLFRSRTADTAERLLAARPGGRPALGLQVFLGRLRRDLAAGRAPLTPSMTLSLGERLYHLIGERCVGAGSRPRMTVMLDPARPSDTPDLLLRIGLTPREAELATRLTRGDSLDDAADALGCAVETARSHLKRVFTKLGVGSRRELILMLMADSSRGIVPAGPDGIP